jgi:hypothetical protein
VKSRKIAAISMRWLVAVVTATAITEPSAADVLYTYQTSALNPFQVGNGEADSFTVAFLSPFVLAPNSYYDLSVSNSASDIGSWSASDSGFSISLTGSNAPISLVPAPGLMAGGVLPFCEVTMLSCLGGAIATNTAGQIDQWNLVADGAFDQSFLTVVTYNNPFIGTVDAFGYAAGGEFHSFENQPGGPTGSWNGVTPSPFPGSAPEPSTWAMMLIGFAGIGFLGYRRALGTA